jgi:hypothetical protein
MALLSFFGSAQAILKILQCKTFSITTTEMSRLATIGVARSVFATNRYGGFPITDRDQPFRRDSRSFLLRRATDFR